MRDNELIIRIVADLKDIKKRLPELEKSLKKTSDKGKKGFKAMDGAVAGFAKRIITTLISIYAIKKGLDFTFKAAVRQERIFRKLRTSVELTGISYESVKYEIDNTFESLQALTEYGDTDSAQALTTLLQLTSDYKKAMKGLPMTLDLAATGLFDVNTAARYVAMAFEGNVEMLGRYIPELKASNNEIIKNGTVAQKTAEFMRIFNEKFTGTAQKNLESTADKLKQINNYLGDIGEAIGDKSLPALAAFLKIITEFLIKRVEEKNIDSEAAKTKQEYTEQITILNREIHSSTEYYDKFGKSLQKLIQYEYTMNGYLESGTILLDDYKLKLGSVIRGLQENFKTYKESFEILSDGSTKVIRLTKEMDELEIPEIDATQWSYTYDQLIDDNRELVNALGYVGDTMSDVMVHGVDMMEAMEQTFKMLIIQAIKYATIWTALSVFFPGSSALAGGGFGEFLLKGLFGSGLAGGNPDAPGGWSMVGERGPEMMFVPQHSQVYTSSQTRTITNNLMNTSAIERKLDQVIVAIQTTTPQILKPKIRGTELELLLENVKQNKMRD